MKNNNKRQLTSYKNHKRRINSKHFPKQKSNRVDYLKCEYPNPRPQKLYKTNKWRKPTKEEIEIKEILVAPYYGTFCNTWNEFISKMFARYRNEFKSYYFWMNKFYNHKFSIFKIFLNNKDLNFEDDEINNYIGAIMATLFKIKDKNSSAKDKNSIPNYLSIEELDYRVQKLIFKFVRNYWFRYAHRKVPI